jgi:CAAX prenyl protease-like protein
MYVLDPPRGLPPVDEPTSFTARARRAFGLRSVGWRALAGGAVIGGALGAHVLVGASLTFGYRISAAPGQRLLTWLTYDLCVNVPLTEGLLRGVLFDRAYRRWPLPAATAVSAAAGVVRYLLDPRLPPTIEAAVGAVFYMALLGAINCWLVARTGSVLPAFASAAAFFAGWRLLAIG